MIYGYLDKLCVVLFFLLPIILIFKTKLRLSLFKIIIITAILSWLIIITSLYFQNQHLNYELSKLNGNIPKEIQDEIDSDGAHNVMGLYFGWAYGVIYLIPWILIKELFNRIIKRLNNKN